MALGERCSFKRRCAFIVFFHFLNEETGKEIKIAPHPNIAALVLTESREGAFRRTRVCSQLEHLEWTLGYVLPMTHCNIYRPHTTTVRLQLKSLEAEF